MKTGPTILALFKEGFKVSSGTVGWYRSSSGADFDNSETASPIKILYDPCIIPVQGVLTMLK